MIRQHKNHACVIMWEASLSKTSFWMAGADGSDCVFVYAKVVDKNGTIVPYANSKVKFEVDGAASLVGANPAHILIN